MKFQPISRSWVAIHPQAKGVIQFIGGAFFGTFIPTFFYRGILSFLYEQGYTLIVIPFSFTFNHYSEAGFLILEQYNLIPELVNLAILKGYEPEIYLDDRNYAWLGHSIGCKYITLLEGFTSLPAEATERKQIIQRILQKTRSQKQIDTVVTQIDFLITELNVKVEQVKQRIQNRYQKKIYFESIFIRGQSSVLMAPVNTGTDSAIPSKILAKLVNSLRWGVSPSPAETFNLIQVSQLFNKMGLASFESDNIARTTVNYFLNILRKPPQELHKAFNGGHFRPMGDLQSQGLLTAFFNAFLKLRQPVDLELLKSVVDFFETLA